MTAKDRTTTSRKSQTRTRQTRAATSSRSSKSSPKSKAKRQPHVPQPSVRPSPHPKSEKLYLAATEQLRSAMEALRRAGADDTTMLGEANFAIDQVIGEERERER